MSSGAVTLGQIVGRLPWLEVACEKCDRKGRYSVKKLIDRHGANYGLPDVAATLSADCPNSGRLTYERCQVFFPQLKTHA